MGFFSGLLGKVAAPLIGGIFDRKRKPQTTTVNYQQMADNARAAGFNPLTALRNGGAAGNTTTTPAFNSSSFIGDAIKAGFNYDPKADARDQEREKLETDIMKAELERLQKDNKADAFKTFGFTPPTLQRYSGNHENSITRDGIPNNPRLVDARRERFGPYVLGGEVRQSNPNYDDAETLEARHGDAVSSLYGFVTARADQVHNKRLKTAAENNRKFLNPAFSYLYNVEQENKRRKKALETIKKRERGMGRFRTPHKPDTYQYDRY